MENIRGVVLSQRYFCFGIPMLRENMLNIFQNDPVIPVSRLLILKSFRFYESKASL